MKNLYSCKLFLVLTILCTHLAKAQDIHFSQFYEAPLYRNPALSGIVTGDVRVQTVHRTQWNSVANAYKTGSLSAEYKMPVKEDDYMTIALQLFYDKAGAVDLTSTQVLPALNYHKSISTERNMYLSVGFMGGWVQRRFDRFKITTNSQYDGLGDGESLVKTQYSYFDGSAGMSLNSGIGENPDNNLLLGVAYHHFNRPKSTFYSNSTIELAPKYVFSGAVKLGMTETSYFTIEADHIRQGDFKETVGGILYGIKIGPDFERPDYTLHGGAFLRWSDAFIPTVKIDYSPFSFGLSYDVNISRLTTNSYGRGGFELSLTYVGFLDRENSSANAVRCPRF